MKMKYRVEKLLKSSGIPFTIFKYAGFFKVNALNSLPTYIRRYIYKYVFTHGGGTAGGHQP